MDDTVTTLTVYVEGQWNNALRSDAFKHELRSLLGRYIGGFRAGAALISSDESEV
ncbi:hypothetical protein SEA_STEPHIG9_88 [Mycobacterium phage Stephig9]|uniref:Uncharacterized protein n=1 Tax=Mycobacterium phage Stephig9 TaxID=2591224 RepID=A0A514DHF8_9CAUD|nr:hypothetical protein SEA_STEPHIG9_88 [Mycobacterium phage Stephig9]